MAAPCGADKLGDAVEPVLVEVVDRAVAQELVRPWERDKRGTTNQRESAMEWRCGRPAAPRGAARMLATRSPPGRWRRWRQATENDGVARQWETSEQRGRRGQPGAQRERGERPAWRRRSDWTRDNGKEASAHPYLARQMSDHGFWQNPQGLNTGVRTKISPYRSTS